MTVHQELSSKIEGKYKIIIWMLQKKTLSEILTLKLKDLEKETFPQDILNTLGTYIKNNLDNIKKADNYIWISKDGTLLSEKVVTNTLKTLCKKYGYKPEDIGLQPKPRGKRTPELITQEMFLKLIKS